MEWPNEIRKHFWKMSADLFPVENPECLTGSLKRRFQTQENVIAPKVFGMSLTRLETIQTTPPLFLQLFTIFYYTSKWASSAWPRCWEA